MNSFVFILKKFYKHECKAKTTNQVTRIKLINNLDGQFSNGREKGNIELNLTFPILL